MTKDFSFYEFVGLLVPSVIFLFVLNQSSSYLYDKDFIEFASLGDSIVFLILSYGLGHIIQAIGRFYEIPFWKLFKGRPTSWLISQRSNSRLFNQDKKERIIQKLEADFGKWEDYDHIVYTVLTHRKLTKRIDIYVGNYTFFKGLTVVFLIITFLTVYYFDWKLSLCAFSIFIISNIRMFRFAKLYAKEIYVTYDVISAINLKKTK